MATKSKAPEPKTASGSRNAELGFMELHPEQSIVWVMDVLPGNRRVVHGFRKVHEVPTSVSTIPADYGYNCFGGIRLRLDGNGNLYPFLGENHLSRLEYSADYLGIFNPRGEGGLVSDFISYDEFREVIMELHRLNVEELGIPDFYYIRPSISAISNTFGVGVALPSDRGYRLVIECVRLKDGAYYNTADGSMELLVVDHNTVARPGHRSEVSPVKAGRETYIIGGRAKNLAHDAEFHDAILSCFDRKKGQIFRLDCSSSCFALVMPDGTVVMPELRQRALFGLTMQLTLSTLQEQGIKVEHRDVDDDMLMEAEYLFTAGTAAGLTPVGRLGWHDGRQKKFDVSGFSRIKQIFDELVASGIERKPGLRRF